MLEGALFNNKTINQRWQSGRNNFRCLFGDNSKIENISGKGNVWFTKNSWGPTKAQTAFPQKKKQTGKNEQMILFWVKIIKNKKNEWWTIAA